jgi:hypothetical protein
VNTASKTLTLTALYCISGAAMAQQQAAPAAPPLPKATAQSEAGDPRADTSSRPAESPAPPAAPSASAASAPASPSAAQRGSGAGQKTPAKTDRLDLGTATVTGDREQPKVMYIVPWKRSDIGDLAGRPMNSLVDEILAPVDRDVFKREVIYYQAVQADASQNAAPPKPAQQGEK